MKIKKRVILIEHIKSKYFIFSNYLPFQIWTEKLLSQYLENYLPYHLNPPCDFDFSIAKCIESRSFKLCSLIDDNE